jgi:hypothetical protein
MSGTVSVSTKALRTLPLPAADEVRTAFRTAASDDEASQLAYARSVCEKEQKDVRVAPPLRGADGE